MTMLDRLMESPLIYRWWQGPFALRKFAPVRANCDLGKVSRVLDIACGPGTNAAFFRGTEYVGVDVNERYVKSARRRHRGRFIRADALEWLATTSEHFDFILINSFLHHLDDNAVLRLLRLVTQHLEPGGSVHILELVLPESRDVSRMLARADRGKYARPLHAWRELLERETDVVHFAPYDISAMRVALWRMVYATVRTNRAGTSCA